ncbi:hypothetical protein CLV51_11218 [Chitinophaga niastensis]|uniref:Uncharacterized protein n=1 Tax=Chitinophaga niastensis TaxID=536980 RepID=A0A2P8H8I1_CHINA|nr:hypothetical protein [Chitinophaga niastensis]PSL42490.1 hypothetical protein CLV51_11218 [Chitinophaga niastensis]
MQADIIKTYFSEYHKQRRVADLEQRLIADGTPLPEASIVAVKEFDGYFAKQMRTKGIKAAIFLVVALWLLYKVVTLANQEGSFLQVSFSLALVAFALVSGLLWGIQLFALKEEITSFKDLRGL